jgi:hypothetical protein
MFAVPQRILTQALSLVMQTLSMPIPCQGILINRYQKFWIVENILEIILSLPKVLTGMYSSDIDSMYQKLNLANVANSTAEEVRRAATIIGADAFFIVVGDTALGNKVDQAFWYNSESGLDRFLARNLTAARESFTPCRTS